MLLLVGSTSAVTLTSIQSGNWSSTTTWGGNPAPVAGDIVIIDGGFTVTIDNSTIACSSIQIGGSLVGSGDGILLFTSASHLTVTGLVTLGVGNRKGSINMTSGGTLTCDGLLQNSLGIWTPGAGIVEFTASNTLPNNGITSFNNLTLSGGTTSLNANTNITGNLLINPGGTLDGGIHQLTISGNWINNGTFTGNTGTVIFDKNGNQTITGTGQNNFNFIKLNMGTSNSNVLEVTATNFSAPDAFLTLSGGTFKVSGTFTFTNGFILGPAYNIPVTGGLWINNPNVTVTGQLGGVSLRGLLRISTGTYNVGIAANDNLDYMPGAVLTIEGGSLNVAGHLGRNNAISNILYSQSGGTVAVVMQGSTDLVFAGFDLGAPASTFTMSGGSIVVSNATSAPADYLVSALASSVTGGTLQIGNANTLNAQTIRIQSTIPVGNILISNATAQTTKPTAQLVAAGLNVVGNVTIQSGTSLNANGQNISLSGNWSNSGTFTPGPTVTFNGTSAQTMVGPVLTNIVVNNATGVSMLGDETMSNTLTLTSGAFSIGAHTLTINGALSIGIGTLVGGTSSNIEVGGSGTGITFPGITVNNLTINRPNGVSLSGDANVNGTLMITNGTLNTGSQTIILGPAATLSEVLGQPVVGNITTTRNVTSITGTVTFGNIGADITLNGVAPGNTTILRKTGTVSTGASHNSIKRYFDITPTTNTGLSADLVFHYDATELNLQNPSLFELYKSSDNGATWNNMGGTVNTISKTVTVLGINDFSRWTIADTLDRIGNTAIPALTGISPSSRTINDLAFTLTVNGTNFINGKSTVRINGANLPTTYINTSKLTAAIPASDLLVIGAYIITVYTAGGGLSNSQTFMVTNNSPTTVSVETAADGSGTIAPAQTLKSGSSITLYAISRDASGSFVANVAANTWVIENVTGGIVASDLVPASDSKSAVFTGHVIGSFDVKATSGILTTKPSGAINVTAGSATAIRVETAADGSGIVVPLQSLTIGTSIPVYSIARDASNNFVANAVATTWNLQNITGGILQTDLVPAANLKSAIFTAHAVGNVNIMATLGVLTAITSGKITVAAPTGVDNLDILAFRLLQNYPNPFSSSTTISWQLPKGCHVSVKVYNSLAKEVKILVYEYQEAGNHSVVFTGNSAMPKGIYFYRIQAGTFIEIKKMIFY